LLGRFRTARVCLPAPYRSGRATGPRRCWTLCTASPRNRATARRTRYVVLLYRQPDVPPVCCFFGAAALRPCSGCLSTHGFVQLVKHPCAARLAPSMRRRRRRFRHSHGIILAYRSSSPCCSRFAPRFAALVGHAGRQPPLHRAQPQFPAGPRPAGVGGGGGGRPCSHRQGGEWPLRGTVDAGAASCSGPCRWTGLCILDAMMLGACAVVGG
jgi:hypothetical protein